MTAAPVEPVTLQIEGTVIIPVGHRVEATILERITYPVGPMPHLPLLTDLDAGVTFGERLLFGTGPHGEPSMTLLPEYREHSRWSGKVLLCRVLRSRRQGQESETTLVIAKDATATSPYR